MSDYQICTEFDCPKRAVCYKYLAVPLGNNQSYIIGRALLGEDCALFEKLDDTKYLNKDSLDLIDRRNREIQRTWFGREC